MKYFKAIAMGKFIVSHEWFIDSINSKKLMSELNYEIVGDVTLGAENGPVKSRNRRGKGIFDQHAFYVDEPFSQKCSADDLELLIRCMGGRRVMNFGELGEIARHEKETKCAVIVEAKENWNGNLRDEHLNSNLMVLALEWLLDSISLQKVCDYQKYIIAGKFSAF